MVCADLDLSKQLISSSCDSLSVEENAVLSTTGQLRVLQQLYFPPLTMWQMLIV
jgi:hypothetical protein